MPKNTLPELLLALRRKINEQSRENKLKDELTGPQFEVLWFIESTGNRSMESIANHLGVKPPSVTALVDKMERQGLVSRKPSNDDRRITNILLTQKTKKQFAALREQKVAAFSKLTSKLSLKDKKEFERILLLLIAD